MYQVDKDKNRINKLMVRRFVDLGFGERTHLQEWLAHCPEALGEELLIIQKEFDGFDDTRERLDLLALDKSAALVIIENKLDDSGRDVVWQSLKYASYCSRLSKKEIVEIFQKYLDRHAPGGDAVALLCDFLQVEDLEEIPFNQGNKQRIVLVAANFRKEVTSTVMWLLGHGIRLQCFKATPYELAGQIFLSLEQIIPVREAEEFMIGIVAKENDSDGELDLKRRHKLRLLFWEKTLDALRISETSLFNNISPSKDHWLNAGSGISGVSYTLIFGSKEVRVELGINRSVADENKFIFDELLKRKSQIQASFGESDYLEWLRLDDKKACRIVFRQAFDGYDQGSWHDMIEWLVRYVAKLELAFKRPLAEVRGLLQAKRVSVTTDFIQENGETNEVYS